VEQVDTTNEHAFNAYLYQHEDETLTMVCCYSSHGKNIGDHPFSGNFKLIRDDQQNIVSIFVLLKCGTLLVSSTVKDSIFELIAQSCQREAIAITSLMAEHELGIAIWEWLKNANLTAHGPEREKSLLQSVYTSILPF